MALADAFDTVGLALQALGIRNLVVGIHDAAFPGDPDDDVGRGSPSSRGAERWLRFVRGLGFTGVQLGPQGQTSAYNPSPYDGTIFAKNPLSIDLRALTIGPDALLSEKTLDEIAAHIPLVQGGRRVPQAYAFSAQTRALAEVFAKFTAAPSKALQERVAAFRQRHAAWLERDALYQALLAVHGEVGFRAWANGPGPVDDRNLWDPPPGLANTAQQRRAELAREHRHRLEAFVFGQVLAHQQHDDLRARCRRLGLDLYGDLQIGLSDQDVFNYRSALLRDYVMGAPPSRTTPEGQPWNYAVLDPTQTDPSHPGPAMLLFAARMDKMFDEFDGVRIDHPHGLVCPWVYRPDQIDPFFAVQHGARLFSSPDLPDHLELARFSIVKPEQLRRDVPRYADDWETFLLPEQIDRYAVLFDAMVDSALRHGKDRRALICEVLSTLPRPLAAVLDRHGLGRFRVVQKANLDDASDVYRPENARPEDWIMVGNHDTLPLWRLVKTWQHTDRGAAWASTLAARLGLPAADLRASPGLLAHAIFAVMFASAAENVSVFFTDLFGFEDPYNTPGTISSDNWSLRLASSFEDDYRSHLVRDQALNLPKALALAFAARPPAFQRAHADLIAKLWAQAAQFQKG
jgi:4-alpha-glucanotransferase